MGEMSTLLHFTTEEQKAVLAKNEQKNWPYYRKILQNGFSILKNSHLRDIIFMYVITNTHRGYIYGC